MSYIGIPPQANFSSGLLDRFTSTTGTTVTLTHDIASENDIVVFVNFVKQDSTTYSVGGTGNKTLTLGGTLVSSDIVEVHYLNIVAQTNAPSSGSVGSSQISADVITGQTALSVAPASTDELLISDAGVLKRIDVSLVGGNNTPSFFAYLGSSQTVANDTSAKVQIDTELFDSGDFNTSTNRFTPTEAGKYFIFAGENASGGGGNSDTLELSLQFYKNGSSVQYLQPKFDNNGIKYFQITGETVADANGTGDYFEIYSHIKSSSSSSSNTFNTFKQQTYFGAFKLIGA